jgi:hypothetical protein
VTGSPGAGGKLWSAVDRRALAYVRLEDARGAGLQRHLDAIERLCDDRGLEIADIVVDVEGGAERESAPPGLRWALEKLGARRARVLAVAQVEHVTGAFADGERLPSRLGDRGATLASADALGAAPSTAELAPSAPPARARRSARRSLGVGPRSWARYLDARADSGGLPNWSR